MSLTAIPNSMLLGSVRGEKSLINFFLLYEQKLNKKEKKSKKVK